MKNIGILLLGLAVVFLSFFVFSGEDNITGNVFIDGRVVSSFIEEEEQIDLKPEITTIHCGRDIVKRGGHISCTFVPGLKGMLTKAGLYDHNDVIRQYIHLCGYGNMKKSCSAVIDKKISFSRTALKPGVHTLKAYDVAMGEYVSKQFTVK